MAVSERSMRIALVTGAGGFIGGRLVGALCSQGITVRAMVRNPAKATHLQSSGAQVLTGDITRPETLAPALEEVDTVFNAAAVLGPAHLPDESYRAVNARGVRNLINSAAQSGTVERFVHVSSVGVLGPLPPREIACEGTPPRPVDVYEITKLEGEEIALAAAAEGAPMVIARPAWVYGPGDNRTLKLFRMIARRRFLMVGPADNKQHPVWVDDVVDGIIRCAVVEGIEGRVYHFGGPEIMKVETLCRTVAEAAGVQIPSFRPPMWMVHIPALLVEKLYSLWGGDPPVDHRKTDFFRINRAYSITRAREDLGWEPKVKFREGIEKTLEYYRKKGKL